MPHGPAAARAARQLLPKGSALEATFATSCIYPPPLSPASKWRNYDSAALTTSPPRRRPLGCRSPSICGTLLSVVLRQSWAWLQNLNKYLSELLALGQRPTKGAPPLYASTEPRMGAQGQLPALATEDQEQGRPGGPRAPKLLEPLLEHVRNWGGDAIRQRLSWVLDVSDIMRLSDRQEKEELACELYELLNHSVLPEGFAIEEIYHGLRQNVISFCEEIEPCFVDFLGTPGCSKLMYNLRAHNPWVGAPPAGSSAAPLGPPPPVPLTDVERDGLVATLHRLELSQALTVVDRSVAGLPLLYVNDAFCALTGYDRKELEGKNCRILQGASTEEVAVAKLVDAIRAGRSETVCVRYASGAAAPAHAPTSCPPASPRLTTVQ